MRKQGKKIGYNDYSDKMPDLNFEYDEDFYTDDLPDPQIDPVLVGARVPIRKVGIAPVDLPVTVLRRDGGEQVLQAQASLYCSLDDTNAKGLNLSRLYLLMHETIKDHVTIDGLKAATAQLAEAQGSKNAYAKLRFKYPWTQNALRSKNKTTGEALEGHIAYDTEIECRWHDGEYRVFLTIEYVYSSTCPCSFELAHDATEKRNAAANAHSQRSRLKVQVEMTQNMVWIEDIIELCRKQIPTEVQIVVKRRDEQAFAELNGSNLLFSEDVCRLMYDALEEWCRDDWIKDFSIAVSHEESLHPWNAIAVTSRYEPNELPGVLS